MTTPTAGAVTAAPPVHVQEANTFDQALEQRRRAQAAEGAIPPGLVQLGELALRVSNNMHGRAPGIAPFASDVPSTALAPKSGAQPQGQLSGEEMMTRAKQLIDSSFGFAVLTQQLVRGANQVASGLMTLLRST